MIAISWRSYLNLMKPGIIMGNAVTMYAGFMLGLSGVFSFALFFAGLLGLSCIIAAACLLNNWIDRAADQKMERTKARALPLETLSFSWIASFSLLLAMTGVFVLWFFTNPLTCLIASFGLVVYVFFYSFLKYKTPLATFVGAIAGSVPPVIGYTAASGGLGLPALLLFVWLFLWQMPHFYAIAIYRMRDYAAAEIPLLPIVRGVLTTKRHMFFYVLGFIAASMLLFVFAKPSLFYAISAAILGVGWVILSWKGFSSVDDRAWARKMFLYSLVVITALSVV